MATAAAAAARGACERRRLPTSEGGDLVPNPTVFLEGEAPFSSSLPLRPPISLPLIYLSKSLIFCILEEDVNEKEFPPVRVRAPRGGDARQGCPRGKRPR